MAGERDVENYVNTVFMYEILNKKNVGEMAQWLRVVATLVEDSGSVSSTNMGPSSCFSSSKRLQHFP